MKPHRLPSILASVIIGLLLVVGLMALFSINAQKVQATQLIFFVKTIGSGSACTQAAPCLLDTALALADDGATIYVAGGTYTSSTPEVVRIDHNISLLGGWDGAASGAVVRNPDLFNSILDGQDARRVVYIERGEPLIDGFTITRGYATKNGGGFYVENGNPLISSNVITDNYGTSYGSVLYVNSGRATVLENQIINNEVQYGGTLIFGNNSQGDVHWNLFEGNKAQYGSAVHTDKAVITYTHNTARNNIASVLSLNQGIGVSKIINNLFYDNSYYHAEFQNNTRALVYHNTFAHCNARAISLSYSAVVTYTNNIITDCTADSIVSYQSTITGTHNLFWNNKTNPYLLASPLVANPKFADPANKNFQLSENSPALNYGVDVGVADDLVGAPRPAGPAPDPGAYERQLPIYLPLICRK